MHGTVITVIIQHENKSAMTSLIHKSGGKKKVGKIKKGGEIEDSADDEGKTGNIKIIIITTTTVFLLILQRD